MRAGVVLGAWRRMWGSSVSSYSSALARESKDNSLPSPRVAARHRPGRGPSPRSGRVPPQCSGRAASRP